MKKTSKEQDSITSILSTYRQVKDAPSKKSFWNLRLKKKSTKVDKEVSQLRKGSRREP